MVLLIPQQELYIMKVSDSMALVVCQSVIAVLPPGSRAEVSFGHSGHYRNQYTSQLSTSHPN
jgi:hypothetical protein